MRADVCDNKNTISVFYIVSHTENFKTRLKLDLIIYKKI